MSHSDRGFAKHESFFVGGTYVGEGDARTMQGQMYVESIEPAEVLHVTPLVFIHGRGQTAVNWLTTPDGRPGWAEWFVERGWRVYLVEQPARGRSAYHVPSGGALETFTTSIIERVFTAPAERKEWPQANLHTQWPGGERKGHPGDPAFDQFYASIVPSLGRIDGEGPIRDAGIALMERIGPAVLVGHSQGGLAAWLIADGAKKRVKAIVAVEPTGPPFEDIPGINEGAGTRRRAGLTISPLAYDPAVTPDSPLEFDVQGRPERVDRVPCCIQRGVPRRLVNLAASPVLVVTSEASYHALFDHCTVRYLREAGVDTTHLRLEEAGIHGNGHMMMLETNSLEIASAIESWLLERVG